MVLLTRIMAGNKLHTEGLSSKYSNGRTLVSGEGRVKETSERGQSTLGVGQREARATLGVKGREGTHALGGWRAGTKEEQPRCYGSLGHSQCQTLEERSRQREGWTSDLFLLPHSFPLLQIPCGQIQLEFRVLGSLGDAILRG